MDDPRELNKNCERRIVSADPLLGRKYKSSDFFILVDRRYNNVNFLEKI